MARTPLYDALAARGALTSKYRGADTATRFGDVNAEFNALRSGCAVFDLGWRAKLVATGPDRVRWLNGMVTNNIRDLGLNRGNYNFLLNAQGRIQADLYVFNRGDYLLLDTEMSQRDKLRELLEKYIIMDDVELASADDELAAIGIAGPKSKECLATLGLPSDLEPLQISDVMFKECGISVVLSEHGNYELWMAPSNAATIWNALVSAGVVPVGTEAVELGRIAAGIPRYGVDIRERDLPQETGQTQALNFSKGCYVGQEIVERIHSRGAVHRTFAGFIFSAGLPAPGSKILAGGKEAGEITSVAALPSQNGTRMIGLGYVRREAVAGGELSVDGAAATISELPFKNL